MVLFFLIKFFYQVVLFFFNLFYAVVIMDFFEETPTTGLVAWLHRSVLTLPVYLMGTFFFFGFKKRGNPGYLYVYTLGVMGGNLWFFFLFF